MQKFTYKIVKKNKDINLATIEKSGLKAEFTLQAVLNYMDQTKRQVTALESQKKVREAQETVFAQKFPELARITKEDDIRAIADYFKIRAEGLVLASQIKEMKKELKEYTNEMIEINKQINGGQNTSKKN